MRFRAARLNRFLHRFRSAKRGAVAVEFALIAVPFIVLVFAVVELGLVMLVNSTLENAIDDASRRVRTGEVQTDGLDIGDLKTTMCQDMNFLGAARCEAAVSLDVRTFPSFAAVADTANVRHVKPINAGAFNDAKMCFDPGGAGSVVLVTAYYPWTLYVPYLSQGLVNVSGNRRLITSAAVFKNEPYNNVAVPAGTCPA